MKPPFRVGIGYDVHALEVGRKCILGGVEIPHEKGLLGHSDADVLIHAVMDAMLGALSLGSIGDLFPDTDDRFKDANSVNLLEQVNAVVREKGFSVGNIDVMVLAEAPKLKPHVEAMKVVLSKALQVEPDQVGIKATTNEKMGFVGRAEGIAAHAVALLVHVNHEF